MARELIERVGLIVFTAICTLAIACAAGVPISQSKARVAQDTTATQTTVQAAPGSDVRVGEWNLPPDSTASP